MKILILIASVASFVSGFCFVEWDHIERISQFATVVASFSVIIAVIEYSSKAKKDQMLSSFEQVSTFRKEVIKLVNEFTSLVEKDKKDYIFSRVNLNTPDIKSVIYDQRLDAEKQADLIRENPKFYNAQIQILNSVEELSIKILYLKIENHEILNPIKNSFIYTLEICAVALLIQKQIFSGASVFQNSLNLYKKWVVDTDNRRPEERLNDLFKKA